MPAGEIAGGALLVHGLTDSPYSMRAVGETLRAGGYYGLALRMPGHGTVPAALTTAVWEDWLAAVRLGVRHVRERIGPGKPLVLVGYSNGGALVLKYALDEVERGEPLPSTRLALISPMIGVAPFAWLARVISLLGPVPYFEKARWLDVIPEYNPFKDNSFPANAGLQSWRLTTDLQAQILRLGKAGRLKELPPVLAFQSIVDATVSTAAVVHALFDQLESNGSELVLFDINRLSGIDRSSTRRSRRSCRASPTGRRGAMRARSSPTRTRIRSRWWNARLIQTQRRLSRGRSGSPGRPRCSRSRTSPCPSRSMTTCMAGPRCPRRPTWCGWAPSVPEASARC